MAATFKFYQNAEALQRNSKKFSGGPLNGSGPSPKPLIANYLLTKERKTLFVAGPPDLIDEEETFTKLTKGDPEIQKLLARQDAALNGAAGGLLWAVSATEGKRLVQIKLNAPPIWDGMAGAGGWRAHSFDDRRKSHCAQVTMFVKIICENPLSAGNECF